MRAYIFIETRAGQAREVAERVQSVASPGAKVIAVDTVTGPYDIIAVVEATNEQTMARILSGPVQAIEGVTTSLPCYAAPS